MFPFSVLHTAQIGDVQLIAVHAGWIVAFAILAPALLVSTMTVANRQQPQPEPTAWWLNDGRWKRAKGRVRPVDWADAR